MKNNKLRLIILFSLAAVLIFTNCDDSTVEFDIKTFNREWAAWEDQGIVDYSVTIRRDHNSIGPKGARIIVKNNVVIRYELLNDTNLFYSTISELYEWVRTSYKEDVKNGESTTYKITYNNDYHYPEYIEMRPQNIPTGMVGRGTTRISLSEFTPLTSLTEE